VSGSGRAVIDMAMRRARVQSLPAGDLYRRVFEITNSQGIGWAANSTAVLSDWGIRDWVNWQIDAPSNNLRSYKAHVIQQVREKCLLEWTVGKQSSQLQIPYGLISDTPSSLLQDLKDGGYPWSSLLHARSFLRLRCGALRLAGIGGRQSEARFQDCIFCGATVRNSIKHCICCCPRWLKWRTQFLHMSGLSVDMPRDELTLCFLKCGVGDSCLCIVLAWAYELELDTVVYWRAIGGDQPA